MKTICIPVVLFVFLAVGCDSDESAKSGNEKPSGSDLEISNRDSPPAKPESPKRPSFEFVARKSENAGAVSGGAIMELYAFSGELDEDALVRFLLRKKNTSSAKVFHYVVVFDGRENAKFPKSPFSALYGVEEDALSHIRALYSYNRLNGFSKVRYHPKNIWGHSAITIDI